MADDPSDGSEKDRNAPTVRDLKGPAVSAGDTVPDIFGQYVPPRPLPEASRHRTIDVKPVRLSAELDPRQARTERRLMSPARPERRPWIPWLAGGVVILLGIGGFVLFQKPSPAKAVAPTAASVVHDSASARSGSRPVAPTKVRSLEPLAVPPPSASVSNGETPATPVTAPKDKRSRDAAKKRKDPWLE